VITRAASDYDVRRRWLYGQLPDLNTAGGNLRARLPDPVQL